MCLVFLQRKAQCRHEIVETVVRRVGCPLFINRRAIPYKAHGTEQDVLTYTSQLHFANISKG